ncbi:hypothetical protein OY671_002412 [Metschnikowia pulcherrima]|nr:hypothetical protein OY671_002412 [Metschnikowia pulcherrima]
MDPRVRQLFKQLVYMSKEYPVESGGYAKLMQQAKRAFRNTDVGNADDLNRALAKGDYIIKELEALYFLKRYRHLKRTYYS